MEKLSQGQNSRQGRRAGRQAGGLAGWGWKQRAIWEGLGMWGHSLNRTDSPKTHISCLDHPKARYKTVHVHSS